MLKAGMNISTYQIKLLRHAATNMVLNFLIHRAILEIHTSFIHSSVSKILLLK